MKCVVGAGATMRAMRLRAGLSVDQLARVTGLTCRTILAIELGQTRSPQFRTVYLIADACGASRAEAAAAYEPDPADAA